MVTTGEITGVLEEIKGGLCPAVDCERLMMIYILYIYIYTELLYGVII